MVKVFVHIDGCHETTHIVMEVTDLEFTFLKKLERLSEEHSDSPCQPTIRLEV